jgi:hypothetical protein
MRWYRTALGRYTQSDPIELPGGINLFLYSAANPIRLFDELGLDTAGCDRLMKIRPNNCELRCCAQHDKCFDDNHCSTGSWGGTSPLPNPAKCGCDQGSGCSKCNNEVLTCLKNCTQQPLFNSTQQKYYCAAQHKFIEIPSSDFPDFDTAAKNCEYDYSQDCKIPKQHMANHGPWYKKMLNLFNH